VDDFYKGGETIRGFATAGIGPRDFATGESYGGKTFYAGTAEIRFPLPFIPDDLGFGGAVFADAGTLYGTDALKFATKYCASHTCSPATPLSSSIQDSEAIRSSVGGSILWNSPIGPLRADFAYALTKESFDQTQVFRFGAATKF
jgi:outer membrane protein insertion porin family